MTIRIIGLVVVGAGLLAFIAIVNQPGKQLEAQSQSDVTIIPVETTHIAYQSDYSATREFTGTIHAWQRSRVGFQVSGLIRSLDVDQGDHIQAEQALGTLDRRRLESQKSQIAAQLSEAQARLEEMVAGPRKQTILSAKANVAELKSQLARQLAQKNRLEQLLQRGVATQDEFDESRYAWEAAEARMQAAQEQLNELQEGTRKEQIQAQRAVVGQLQASLESIDIDLVDTILKSPFQGMVSKRFVDEGRVITAGEPVFEIIDQRLEIQIGVPPELVTDLVIGESYLVRVNGVELTVTLKRIVNDVDPATRTVLVILALPVQMQIPLVPEQVVRLQVTQSNEQLGFWIPRSALIKSTRGLWSCFSLEESSVVNGAYQASLQLIEILHVDNDRAYVRGTMDDGALVISSGAHRLVNGQLVKPISK